VERARPTLAHAFAPGSEVAQTDHERRIVALERRVAALGGKDEVASSDDANKLRRIVHGRHAPVMSWKSYICCCGWIPAPVRTFLWSGAKLWVILVGAVIFVAAVPGLQPWLRGVLKTLDKNNVGWMKAAAGDRAFKDEI